ncbi:MAG: carbonic anhydrase [Flavobacteriales bacterium]|nr:carbonic anhydrase [Flavobacteriales bacterium]
MIRRIWSQVFIFGLVQNPIYLETKNYMSIEVLTKKERDKLSAGDVISRLKKGNLRYADLNNDDSDSFHKRLEETAQGQFPCAIVLGCIDSRVPAEIIFDQSIGDVFNVRVAGNVLSPDVLGSIEYACALSGVKLIVVLGHTECGAVKGACADVELGNLTGLLEKIKPAVKMVRAENHEFIISSESHFNEAVSKQNVFNVMENVYKESPVLAEKLRNREIEMVGAMYHVANGLVEFYAPKKPKFV